MTQKIQKPDMADIATENVPKGTMRASELVKDVHNIAAFAVDIKGTRYLVSANHRIPADATLVKSSAGAILGIPAVTYR